MPCIGCLIIIIAFVILKLETSSLVVMDKKDVLPSLKVNSEEDRLLFKLNGKSKQKGFSNKVTEVKGNSYCRLRYRVRWFSSKAAFLILIWNILLHITSGSLENTYQNIKLVAGKNSNTLYSVLVDVVPYSLWLIVAPLSGWLADVWFGNYRVAQLGFVLLFISSILECLIYQMSPSPVNFDSTAFVTVLIVSNAIGFAGQANILVTLLPLGLDQMPDASTSNITSFIAWFVFCIQSGFWIGDFTSLIPMSCILDRETSYSYIRVWSLFPVLCICFILLSDQILTPKWLTIEPTSPQSLKAIFRVLKYAKDHKAPVQRSALTYWEEDIPSRVDFGKTRYGGPFTTEQVEDVKTILRLLVLSLPLWLVMTSFYLGQQSPIIPNQTQTCSDVILSYFTSNVSWWLVFGTVIYEFFIYPFIMHLLPSIFRRIGAVSFLIVIINILYLILTIVGYASNRMSWPWITYPSSILSGFLKIAWMTSALELLCAQSPYNMRGLLIGYLWCLNMVSYMVVDILYSVLTEACSGDFCLVIYSTLATGLSVVGFIVYSVLAYWYKRRKRDDISTPHKWVEEVYNRYL